VLSVARRLAASSAVTSAYRIRPASVSSTERVACLANGELWKLDPLAAACADRRWSFLLTAPPLSVVAGVGSPRTSSRCAEDWTRHALHARRCHLVAAHAKMIATARKRGLQASPDMARANLAEISFR